MPTAKLPILRKTCAIFECSAGVLGTAATVALLVYQVTWTVGYQKPIPALIASSFLAAVFPPFFVFFNRPLGTNKFALFLKSIAFELIVNGGILVLSLISVANLHAETPGVLLHCGKFLTCRMLAAVMALTWLVFFFSAVNFTLLLLGLLYFVYKRNSPIPSLVTPFSEVDWQMYEQKARRSVANRLSFHRSSHANSRTNVAKTDSTIVPMEKFVPLPPVISSEDRAAREVSILFDDEPSARRRSLNWGRRELEQEEPAQEKGVAL